MCMAVVWFEAQEQGRGSGSGVRGGLSRMPGPDERAVWCVHLESCTNLKSGNKHELALQHCTGQVLCHNGILLWVASRNVSWVFDCFCYTSVFWTSLLEGRCLIATMLAVVKIQLSYTEANVDTTEYKCAEFNRLLLSIIFFDLSVNKIIILTGIKNYFHFFQNLLFCLSPKSLV